MPLAPAAKMAGWRDGSSGVLRQRGDPGHLDIAPDRDVVLVRGRLRPAAGAAQHVHAGPVLAGDRRTATVVPPARSPECTPGVSSPTASLASPSGP